MAKKRRSREQLKLLWEATCSGCAKWEHKKCQAFKEPYYLWNDDTNCWARELDPKKWEVTKSKTKPILADKIAHNRALEMARLQRISDNDISQVYYAEVHKELHGAPRGEKADRTNKTFGPNQMKDNRFAGWKWRKD